MTLPSGTLSGLAAMPDLLDSVFRAVPEQLHSWTPGAWDGVPGERFSALGHVCHLRDIERDGYHVRIARMLHEENPSLISIDGYELALARDYDSADPEAVLASFRAARRATLDMLKGLTTAQLERRGTFAEYGSVTLRSLVHYLASHDHQHLACLEWLLGKSNAANRVGRAAVPVNSQQQGG